MTETSDLQNCYSKLSAIPGIQIEPIEIIKMVEQYRHYWMPEKVRVILLAESYVYTTRPDYNLKLNSSFLTHLGLAGYPSNFVRFVYCLGYGEDDMLIGSTAKNSGTPQFWKIFYSCIHPIQKNEDFKPILKGGTDFGERMKNKVRLLQELKARGIWLLDASLMALYRDGEKPAKIISDMAILICWENYIKKLITESHPQKLVCVGSGVAKTLENKLTQLKKEIGIQITVIPQPGAFLPAQEHLENFKRYYGICDS